MRVLICGSRSFAAAGVINAMVRGLAETYPDLVVIHGAAKGADTLAGEAAKDIAKVEEYPADWEQYGKKAGYLRNKQMLEEGQPDLVLAFVDKPLTESKGTHMMVNLAEEAGIAVYVVRPSNKTVKSWKSTTEPVKDVKGTEVKETSRLHLEPFDRGTGRITNV